MAKTYEEIKKQCDALGISISELSREARICRTLLARWQEQEPKTLRTYRKIWAALSRIKQSQQAKEEAYKLPEEDGLISPE